MYNGLTIECTMAWPLNVQRLDHLLCHCPIPTTASNHLYCMCERAFISIWTGRFFNPMLVRSWNLQKNMSGSLANIAVAKIIPTPPPRGCTPPPRGCTPHMSLADRHRSRHWAWATMPLARYTWGTILQAQYKRHVTYTSILQMTRTILQAHTILQYNDTYNTTIQMTRTILQAQYKRHVTYTSTLQMTRTILQARTILQYKWHVPYYKHNTNDTLPTQAYYKWHAPYYKHIPYYNIMTRTRLQYK